MEMKALVNYTSGVIILSDSFNTAIFKQSFMRVFTKDMDGQLNMGFNATLEVQVIFFYAYIDVVFVYFGCLENF